MVVAAIALLGGVPFAAVALGVAAVTHPALAGVAMAVWALRRRRERHPVRTPDDEAAFLGGLASELAAGAPPRFALVAAASRAPRLDLRPAARLAAAGMSADRVAPRLAEALPTFGRLSAAAWHMAATVGGPTATMFDILAVRASDEAALRRERRALTAQARASAAVVAGLPVLVLVGMAATGRLSPASDPALGLIVALGVGFQLVGVGVVWAMLQRAS